MVNKKRVGMMVAVTLLTGVLLFCSVFFLVRRANREITQRSFDELATATRQIAKDLVDAANADQTILSAMAELIAGHDERDNDAVLRIMKSFSLSETFVSTVALLRPDGTLLLTDGTRYDVSDTFDFETEAARGAYISDRVTSYFAPEKLVVRNVVPVVRDGETVAILYGVVLLQELSRNYQIDLYNGNAFLLLVDGNNGDILLDTWHDSLGNISELRGRKMLKGYTYEEAMKKIPNGIGGDMCTVSRSTGLTVYLHYEPVGINNWSVVLGVSEAEALTGTRGVVQTLSMMAIIVTALLLSYLGFMVWYLASARRGVYRMSITDQGTGLMNRVAYEKCLRKSDQRVIAPAACIYIDANGLHEINNERGHEAGDQLLRAVAERLREQFPRDDLYRVGGDEFVVFPAPASEAEYEARMWAVSESLAAQGYSISYGIAVCEAANGLRELVREADEKMLYGDNVIEKHGINRDSTGDREKTRYLCGKQGIFTRDRALIRPGFIRQLETRASTRSASFFHALGSPGRPHNGGGEAGAYRTRNGAKPLKQGHLRAKRGPLGPSRKSQQQTKRTGFAAHGHSIAETAPEGKRASCANGALIRA